jgi:predicted membrane protein
MDWTFYLIVFLVLFSFLATMLAIRYIVNRRLENIERKQRLEEEAKQVAETNSGL